MRFVFLPDIDDSMRAKWTLMAQSKGTAETDLLRGYRRTLAVDSVRASLASRSKPHTIADIASWFATVHIEAGSEKMTASVVAQHLKVHDRVSSNRRAAFMLDTLESTCGRHHPLSSLTSLDVVCKKTAVPKNRPLEAALISWVVSGFAVLKARGLSDMPTAKGGVATLTSVILLIRRLVHYLISRFPPKTTAGGSAKDTVLKIFGDWAMFHRCFPKGDALDIDLDDVAPSALGHLDDNGRVLVEFLAALMDIRNDVYTLLKAAAVQNPLVPPEQFLMREDVRASSIFDITAYGEAQSRKEQEPPVTAEDAEKAPPAPVAENMGETTGEHIDAGNAEEPEDQGVTDVLLGETFPDLVLGDEARTKLKRVDKDTFLKMKDSAMLRPALSSFGYAAVPQENSTGVRTDVASGSMRPRKKKTHANAHRGLSVGQGLNSYVELRVCNSSPAETRCAIQDAERREEHVNYRRVWLYNAGCATERTSGCGVAYPFRLLPDHDATGFKAMLGMLFGEAPSAALPPSRPAAHHARPPAGSESAVARPKTQGFG